MNYPHIIKVVSAGMVTTLMLAACESNPRNASESTVDSTMAAESTLPEDTTLAMPATQEDFDREMAVVRDRYPQAHYWTNQDSTVDKATYPDDYYTFEVEGIEDENERSRVREMISGWREERAARRNAVVAEVDEKAAPTGGYDEFYTLVKQNLTYPEEARDEGVEGTVFVEFDVDTQGKINNVAVAESNFNKTGYQANAPLAGGSMYPDEEVVKLLQDEATKAVLSTSGQWTPAQKDDQAVASRLEVPITFDLNPY
ncbi:TonB family C-terminal domain-containing protein [Catalinimonas alkaloidigena]|uniref:TonB family C-terminal domain-containing protein n=1 Tax=Catalinimonas alkaloidigena TaxID=1075417 RepID=A0A1G9BZN3_9BACT|nr:energy transducer TonB [Catalinimonas alkaloidigena]SDK44890.1 TonB family C-terminal domain-containing protein [Catalinimonas alkaloidigena]